MQTKLKTSSNIGRDKSFVDDLNKERGIVRMRVAFVPRSAEIQPLFWRFVKHSHHLKHDNKLTTCQKMVHTLLLPTLLNSFLLQLIMIHFVIESSKLILTTVFSFFNQISSGVNESSFLQRDLKSQTLTLLVNRTKID